MRKIWLVFSVIFSIALLTFALSCGGGKGPVSPGPGGGGQPSQDIPQPPQPPAGTTPISLLISASPSSGPAPLQVNLFVSATGGREPYVYEWDFENDGIFDSTSQTPFHTYSVTSVARVKVSDAQGNEANGSRTILVNGEAGGDTVNPLVALFGMDKLAGPVPLLVNFTGFADGGIPPYKYRWDFDNDGRFDSFVKDPFYTYNAIGTPVLSASGSKWVYYPTLEVEDSKGRKAAYNAEVNVRPATDSMTLTAFANPPTGQAPLLVSFDGGAEGGVRPYKFKWTFGEGPATGWQDVSQADHLYANAGIYQASLIVKDSEGLEIQSGTISVRVEESQQLKAAISADIVNSSVPFNSNFSSDVSGGKEPFTYTWSVFSKSTSDDDATDPSRGIVGTAIVTPTNPLIPNPTIHFASEPFSDINGDGNVTEYDPIMVQLVVTDASGSQSVSNAITITPQAPSFLFFATRPPTDTFQSGYSANFGSPSPSKRINPAVVTHPNSGVTFMFGGDTVDGSGNFTGITDLLQSAWAYNANTTDFAYANGFRATTAKYPANSWVELNAVRQSGAADGSVGGIGGGAFPSGEMRYNTPAQTTLRSDAFIPRGSAAAIFVHENVETNPTGGDYSGCMALAGSGGNSMPDDPADQGLDLNGMNGPGPGVPVIYVVGGRDKSGNALTNVQKYYPPGFGTELMPIDCFEACGCATGDFQVTNNQVDIWRDTFLAPDRDFWPQVDQDPRNPIVRDRVPGSGTEGAGPLAQLPVGVYGQSGFALESLPYLGNLPWPLGGFNYIFILGGKEWDGHVSNEFRILDINVNPANMGGGGNQNPRNPEYPYWSYVRSGDPQNGPVQFMPIERYDFDVALQYADPSRGQRWKLYVFGGTDQNGEYISQVDVFTFENVYGPNTGTWSTLAAALPEPAAGLNAAVDFDPALGYVYHVFGGRTRDKIIGNIYSLEGQSFVPDALKLIPKYGAGLGFSYAGGPFSGGFTYYRVAGFTEEGMDPYVEFFQVP